MKKPLTYGSTAEEYCFTCGRVTSWSWSGCENGDRPRVDMWVCRSDGRVRLQMADVTDAENLAKSILDRQLRARGNPLNAGEYEDALALTKAELVDLYVAWDPDRGVRFTAYATGLLRLRVNNWWRQELGNKTPKAHFGALSLDGGWDEDSELEVPVAAWTGDPQVDRSADLNWTLAQGGRVMVPDEPA